MKDLAGIFHKAMECRRICPDELALDKEDDATKEAVGVWFDYLLCGAGFFWIFRVFLGPRMF